MTSRDCLGWSDDESFEVPKNSKKPTTRKRPQKQRSKVSKKKKTSDALTLDDLPSIVKAVVDSLPGSSARKAAEDRECEGYDESSLEPQGNSLTIY